jgi:hypothetical protein
VNPVPEPTFCVFSAWHVFHNSMIIWWIPNEMAWQSFYTEDQKPRPLEQREMIKNKTLFKIHVVLITMFKSCSIYPNERFTKNCNQMCLEDENLKPTVWPSFSPKLDNFSSSWRKKNWFGNFKNKELVFGFGVFGANACDAPAGKAFSCVGVPTQAPNRRSNRRVKRK